MKTCPQCRFWQPPEASSCQMCGASFDEPVADPMTPSWEDDAPTAAAEVVSAPTKARRTRTPSSRTRRLAIAGTLAGVLVVALAGFTWYRNRPPELQWTVQKTPLGLGSVKEAGSCKAFSPSADDDVAVGGRLCDIGDGSWLVVIEFDFRSRDLSKVEPRFLAGSLMQGTDGVQDGALDSFTPSGSEPGTAGDLTGRGTVAGQQVKTLGRIVEAGNRGIMVLAAAAEPDDVADAFHTMASSISLGSPAS